MFMTKAGPAPVPRAAARDGGPSIDHDGQRRGGDRRQATQKATSRRGEPARAEDRQHDDQRATTQASRQFDQLGFSQGEGARGAAESAVIGLGRAQSQEGSRGYQRRYPRATGR